MPTDVGPIHGEMRALRRNAAYRVGKFSTSIESEACQVRRDERILSSVDAVLGKVITQRPLADAHQFRGVFLHAG